jgi:hypothetical protein
MHGKIVQIKLYGDRQEGQIDRHSNQGRKKSAGDGMTEKIGVRPENLEKKN